MVGYKPEQATESQEWNNHVPSKKKKLSFNTKNKVKKGL